MLLLYDEVICGAKRTMRFVPDCYLLYRNIVSLANLAVVYELAIRFNFFDFITMSVRIFWFRSAYVKEIGTYIK